MLIIDKNDNKLLQQLTMSYQRSYSKNTISQFQLQRSKGKRTEYQYSHQNSKFPIRSYQQLPKQYRNNPIRRQCEQKLNNINTINSHISQLLAVVNKIDRDRQDQRSKNDLGQVSNGVEPTGFRDYKRRVQKLQVLQQMHEKNILQQEYSNKMKIYRDNQEKLERKYRRQYNYSQNKCNINNIDDRFPISRPSGNQIKKTTNLNNYRSRSPVIAVPKPISKYCKPKQPKPYQKQIVTSMSTFLTLKKQQKQSMQKRESPELRRRQSSQSIKRQDTIYKKLYNNQFESNHISEQSKQVSNFESSQNDKDTKNKLTKLFSFVGDNHKNILVQDDMINSPGHIINNYQSLKKQKQKQIYQTPINPRHKFQQQNKYKQVYELKLKQMQQEQQSVVHIEDSSENQNPQNKQLGKNIHIDNQVMALQTNFQFKLIPCSLNAKNIKSFIADKFANIVLIDVQLNKMKEIFLQYNVNRFSLRYKKQLLVKVLQSRGVFIEIYNLDNLINFQNISPTLHESQTAIPNFNEFLHSLVDKFLQSQYQFEKKIIHMLTMSQVRETGFLPAHLDLQNNGYLKVKDLACFINLHGTGSYCFKNKDVKDLFSKFIRIQISMIEDNSLQTQSQKRKQIQQLRQSEKISYETFLKVISDKL